MGAPVDSIFLEHLERLRASTIEGDTLASLPRWITTNTTLKGEPFSFKDHEYQEQIVSDQAPEKNVRKCSQVGVSELTSRVVLGVANVLHSSTMIYTLPTADFAKTFVKTRVDPIIAGSPRLRATVNPTADNTQIKQFNDSFVYFKGTVGQAAAISVPADGVFHDELDFSDPDVVATYQSRLAHSAYKLKWKFSTPTVEGFGICAEMAVSRRFFNFVKCDHCNFQFLPDYFSHVKIPDFGGDLREIRKDNLYHTRFTEAYVECPNCGKQPSLQPEHREWVCENSDQHFVASGYQVTPFDAPNIRTCADLIKDSTVYKRYVDFVNFALGLPAEDKESSLTRAEIEACIVRGLAPTYWTTVMGIDMGMLCHVMISAVDPWGKMFTVKTELIPLPRFQDRVLELKREFRVAMTVMDCYPYTETLIRMQAVDPNLYGAVFVKSKDLWAYDVKKEDEAKEEAQQQIRQVNVNRNKAFDQVMTFVRMGNWQVLEDVNREAIVAQMTDMKRVRDPLDADEKAYIWQKSPQKNDHFHHAFLYSWVAAQLRGVASGGIALPWLVNKFKTNK